MFTKNRSMALGAALIMLQLIACSDDAGNAAPQAGSPVAVAVEDLRPADPQLAEIYQRSCRNCHAVAGTGAPLTGNSADWQDRIDQGMDIMVQRVIEGYGGMPPLGMCFDCDEEQFTALVTFMVQPVN